MSFGVPERGAHAWTLDEQRSRPIIKHALDVGINFFDTANSYSDGTSEEIVGRALLEYTRREEIVLATKVYFPNRVGPNQGGLSRKAIMREIDASLTRLDTDYVDLYQIHRWDAETPIEETLEALHDVVKAGKARYIGASSMHAFQFAQALYRAEMKGWTRFISMQNHVNLLYREEEREMIPLCKSEGVAVLAWSPLARGRLARPLGASSDREVTDLVGKSLYTATAQADREVIEAVTRVARARGVSPAQVALAWVRMAGRVTVPIIGATRPEHIDDAVTSLSVDLTAEEIQQLEGPYVPHPVAGFEVAVST
jgi:aryl-alcohol dehydrogenase-like predicted oxidoreductase